MAAVIDLGTNADRGVYGLHNLFRGRITRTGAAVFKLKYRIRLTFGVTGEQIVKDVDPINEIAALNVVDPMKDYFAQKALNDNGGTFEEPAGMLEYALNSVQIEVGEVSASVATDPPIFGGYDTDDTLWFNNGWEDIIYPSSTYENYRISGWWGLETFKIPLINKSSIKILNNSNKLEDIILPLSSYVPYISGSDYFATEVVLTYSDSTGLLGTTNNALPVFTIATNGIYVYGIGSQIVTDLATYPTATRVGAVVTYSDGVDPLSSENVVFDLVECHPKFDDFMLTWCNRFSAPEQMLFTLNNQKRIDVSNGKSILSDNINISSTSFGDCTNPLSPNTYSFGKSVKTSFTLNSDYLTQDESDSLRDLFTSSIVIMYQTDSGGIYIKRPVMVQDTSYEIKDVRNGLVRVSVKVEVLDAQKIQTQ